MSSGHLGFHYRVRGNGEVVITRHGQAVTVLRKLAAERFIAAVATTDPQQLMARATGNYRRGNERPPRRRG